MQIPVIDIFAGPGGLGEGFSSYTSPGATSPAFRIAVSAEMERNAAKTLRLRAFFRQFPTGHAPDSYYEYVAGARPEPWTEKTRVHWDRAGEEARQLELGVAADDSELHERISLAVRGDKPWVLVGGPPCQAYSLVGRARNRSIVGYVPETDERHFLYRHYLEIIRQFRPTIFVMENVKGILSSRIDGELIFPRIMDDLHRPGGRNGPHYRIHPLVDPAEGGFREAEQDPYSFVLRSEELGVPQARHRVILVGVSDELGSAHPHRLKPTGNRYSVGQMIGGLPPLRSGVTDTSFESWPDMAFNLLTETAGHAHPLSSKAAAHLSKLAREAQQRGDPGSGGRWVPTAGAGCLVPDHLSPWIKDPRLSGLPNHEVRRHMRGDLMRYAYASAYAKVEGRSPRGAAEFPEALHPNHRNWRSGKFVDRFKVQLWDEPSSTITSHLSKDGHYFIHPDPSQLRSLSVREAARLQTFPDNYFFEGGRGAQFHQIGNAVPPWLARQIAEVVHATLRDMTPARSPSPG